MPPERRTINYSRVVDLGHPIHPDIPRWPGDPPVTFKAAASLEREGYRLNAFSMGEHTGAHMNAPRSFHPQGPAIDSYEASSLVAEAVVIDVTAQAASDPDYALDPSAIESWEDRWGPVPAGSLALLRSGWDRKYSSPGRFFGFDREGNMHYPGFSPEAARFLLEQRQVHGLGADSPGLDPSWDNEFTVNRLVLQQPRLALECLNNLGQLPAVGATLVIGILKLRGGSGSPASVIALVP